MLEVIVGALINAIVTGLIYIYIDVTSKAKWIAPLVAVVVSISIFIYHINTGLFDH